MNTLVQGSKEWLEFRRNKIGASDACIIMEVSPWCTPLKLWERKVGISPDQEKTDAMQRGLDLEDDARLMFAFETGVSVKPSVKTHSKHDWMIASLDGISSDGKNIVEIKCPGREDHEKAKSGNIPDKYYPQLQHQLEVVGLDMAYYMSYMTDLFGTSEDNVILEIYRDDRYIKQMIEREQEFYECLKNFIAPKLTEKDYVCKDDSAWRAKVEEYMKIKALIDREKELREDLIRMSEGKNCRGAGVKTQKVIRKGNIDYSKIPELSNVDLEKYRGNPVEFWKINIT